MITKKIISNGLLASFVYEILHLAKDQHVSLCLTSLSEVDIGKIHLNFQARI